MSPSVLALLFSSISVLLMFHVKIILSAVFLSSMLSGHHQQHHHPQHDLHQNLPEVWPVGRQPSQHRLRPGLLHWAAAATGTHTQTHTPLQQPNKNTSVTLSFIRYDTGMGWFGEREGLCEPERRGRWCSDQGPILSRFYHCQKMLKNVSTKTSIFFF